jgi:hypothetical protein
MSQASNFIPVSVLGYPAFPIVVLESVRLKRSKYSVFATITSPQSAALKESELIKEFNISCAALQHIMAQLSTIPPPVNLTRLREEITRHAQRLDQIDREMPRDCVSKHNFTLTKVQITGLAEQYLLQCSTLIKFTKTYEKLSASLRMVHCTDPQDHPTLYEKINRYVNRLNTMQERMLKCEHPCREASNSITKAIIQSVKKTVLTQQQLQKMQALCQNCTVNLHRQFSHQPLDEDNKAIIKRLCIERSQYIRRFQEINKVEAQKFIQQLNTQETELQLQKYLNDILDSEYTQIISSLKAERTRLLNPPPLERDVLHEQEDIKKQVTKLYLELIYLEEYRFPYGYSYIENLPPSLRVMIRMNGPMQYPKLKLHDTPDSNTPAISLPIFPHIEDANWVPVALMPFLSAVDAARFAGVCTLSYQNYKNLEPKIKWSYLNKEVPEDLQQCFDHISKKQALSLLFSNMTKALPIRASFPPPRFIEHVGGPSGTYESIRWLPSQVMKGIVSSQCYVLDEGEHYYYRPLIRYVVTETGKMRTHFRSYLQREIGHPMNMFLDSGQLQKANLLMDILQPRRLTPYNCLVFIQNGHTKFLIDKINTDDNIDFKRESWRNFHVALTRLSTHQQRTIRGMIKQPSEDKKDDG